MSLNELFADYGGLMFPLPDIAGTYSGGLIICGDAACIWDDLEDLGCKSTVGRGRVQKEEFDFMTINKVGEVFPGNIEHWYSNEGKLLQNFVSARRNEYRKEFDGPRHTHSCNRGVKWHWPWGGHGTSGLGSIFTGLALGYDSIIVCGMPLDDGPHNGEPPWRTSNFSREVSDTERGGADHHWKRAIQKAFDGKVRSMSGRTRRWIIEYG